jgi:hypothetical protein
MTSSFTPGNPGIGGRQAQGSVPRGQRRFRAFLRGSGRPRGRRQPLAVSPRVATILGTMRKGGAPMSARGFVEGRRQGVPEGRAEGRSRDDRLSSWVMMTTRASFGISPTLPHRLWARLAIPSESDLYLLHPQMVPMLAACGCFGPEGKQATRLPKKITERTSGKGGDGMDGDDRAAN